MKKITLPIVFIAIVFWACTQKRQPCNCDEYIILLESKSSLIRAQQKELDNDQAQLNLLLKEIRSLNAVLK